MTTDAVGGVWQYSLELSRHLERSGVRVTLVSFGPPPRPAQVTEAARHKNVRLLIAEHRLEWMDEPWADVDDAGEWLLSLERDSRPDVIHLNQFSFGALLWRAPALVVGHSCVYSWWQAVRGGRPGPHWQEYHRRVAEGLQGADLVVTPTTAMMRALRRCYGVPVRRRVIPNGRDPQRFRPEIKQNFVLTAGRAWDQAKNVVALDRVASNLPWPVYALGPTEQPDGAKMELKHLNSTGALDGQGAAQWFGRAAIYAHPALYEPFGLCALEAGLSGCALVLSDIASLGELWHGAAFFVPPHDERELTRTLLHLIGHPALREAFGKLARERALLYSAGRMGQQYLSVYHELTTSRPARSAAGQETS